MRKLSVIQPPMMGPKIGAIMMTMDHNAERHSAPLDGIVAQQDRLRNRHHGTGDQSLNQTRTDQHRQAVREAADGRENHEQQNGGDEGSHFAEAPRDPSRERLHDRGGEHVGADGPGAFRCGDAQAAGNRRHGDIDDGHVKNLHERGGRDGHGQKKQLAAVQRRVFAGDGRPRDCATESAIGDPIAGDPCRDFGARRHRLRHWPSSKSCVYTCVSPTGCLTRPRAPAPVRREVSCPP